MPNSRARVHHYVPKALQRYFCHSGEKIYFAERTTGGSFGQLEPRNISSTFKRGDYYTIQQDGAASDVVERQLLGKLDNFLGVFLQEAHKFLDRGQFPNVQGELIEEVRFVASFLLRRSPDFVERHGTDAEIGRDILEKTLASSIEAGLPETDQGEIRLRLANNIELRRLGRQARVPAQVSRLPRVEETLSDFEVRWVETAGLQAFILSSRIGYIIGNGGINGIANPDAEIWFPISPKRCLVLRRDPNNIYPKVYRIGRDHVRQINSYAIRNSVGVASHSEKLLSSLINSRWA